MHVFTIEAMVRGYHVYQTVWEVNISEVLPCIREPGNRHDPYAIEIAVTRHKDTPIITPASFFSVHLMEISVDKILANG